VGEGEGEEHVPSQKKLNAFKARQKVSRFDTILVNLLAMRDSNFGANDAVQCDELVHTSTSDHANDSLNLKR
jgi:hypothetical protein